MTPTKKPLPNVRHKMTVEHALTLAIELLDKKNTAESREAASKLEDHRHTLQKKNDNRRNKTQHAHPPAPTPINAGATNGGTQTHHDDITA